MSSAPGPSHWPGVKRKRIDEPDDRAAYTTSDLGHNTPTSYNTLPTYGSQAYRANSLQYPAFLTQQSFVSDVQIDLTFSPNPPPPSSLQRPAAYSLAAAHSPLAWPEIAILPNASFETSDPLAAVRCLGLVQDSTNRGLIDRGYQRWSDPPTCDAPPTVAGGSSPSERVCFGMITNIHGKCDQQASQELQSTFPVQLLSSDSFLWETTRHLRGNILAEHGTVIHGLLEEESITIHAACTVAVNSGKGKTSRGVSRVPCTLTMTIYGPVDMLEELGEWLQEYDVYLQDPLVCHMDVRYCNPHRIHDAGHSMSQVVLLRSKPIQLLDITHLPDLLDTLNTHDDLEEAPTPSRIKTQLQRHQGQALTFMLQREQGWAFRGPRRDVWEIVETDQHEFFVNRVSGTHQVDEPPPFSGGIIADPMGLGKTLTMIALVASDLDAGPQGIAESLPDVDVGSSSSELVSTTLIIVPPSLIDTWENEIALHAHQGGLSIYRHHGKTRIANPSKLRGIDIVLTGFDTVSAEWKHGKDTSSCVTFSVCWRRVILDEAHFVRNGASRRARAVCSINALSRWAVTGTPIQNRLSDLATLLKFIRAHPYTNPNQFDTDISQLWKCGQEEDAVKRLKLLSSCLLLRRPPDTIRLPSRRDMICPVDFSPAEREVYEKAREQAITRIDEALHQGTEFSRRAVYVNVLQQIESLRQICDMGVFYSRRHDDLSDPTINSARAWTRAAQRVFNAHRDQGTTICLQCNETLELTDVAFDDFPAAKNTAWFFSCLRYLCPSCVNKQRPKSPQATCGHSPSCPEAIVSVSNVSLEEVPDVTDPEQPEIGQAGLPSKVEALITDLRSLPHNTKSIVFSTWRMALNLVERGLKQANIPCVRFDGKVPQKERGSVAERFKTDKSIRVMLLTLHCGAVGLTLTVASRAYLMEPIWNPTLEDQALARIHRIGQTQEVTTIRFYIRDSFEEEVMKLQKKKKQLAGVLLSAHDGSQSEDTLDRLHELRRLL